MLFMNILKKQILKCLRNNLNLLSCVYYFVEVVKDPSVYTYEKSYGAHRRVRDFTFGQAVMSAKKNLATKR